MINISDPLFMNEIGTQVSLASFHRYGVPRILDHLQSSCGVNLIRLHADDRVRSTEEFFSLDSELPHSNLCGIPTHPGNYRDSTVQCQPYMGKLPAARRLGLLTELRRELDARSMQLHVRVIFGADNKRDSFSSLLSQDENGQLVPRPCNHNPRFLGFLHGLAEDIFRTSPVRVDGCLHMYEIGSLLGGQLSGGHLTQSCFCPHCCARASAEGINPLRVREGLRALKLRLAQAAAGQRRFGFDGLFAFLLDYPELPAWDALQWRAFHDSVASVKGIARLCQPEARIGVHLLHGVSWNFPEQAGYRPEHLARYADYIKPLFYHTFSGLRGSVAIKRFHQLFMPEAPLADAYRTFLQLQGMDPARHPAADTFFNEGQFDAADYVHAGMARFTRTPDFQTPLIANVGWEDEFAPAPADPRATQTYHATRAAIDAGAAGIFLSRQFSPELVFGSDRPIAPVTQIEASAGGSKTTTDGDVGPRALAAYSAALHDAGWLN